MLKHALLEDEATLGRLLDYNPVYPEFDSEALLPLLRASVLVKQRIVEEDLTEKGLRKALNLGHTIGHAFESFSFAHLFACAAWLRGGMGYGCRTRAFSYETRIPIGNTA